jgi:hypothetical protein
MDSFSLLDALMACFIALQFALIVVMVAGLPAAVRLHRKLRNSAGPTNKVGQA